MELYGGVHRDEMEVTIRLDAMDAQAHICSTWPEWSRKLERLYGPPKKTTERAGKVTSAFWTVPVAVITLRRAPAKGRQMTAEEREAARERMRHVRQARLSLKS